MKLIRTTPNASWRLDDKYEIEMYYNHGYGLKIRDLTTLVSVKDWSDPKGERMREIPQEHVYFSGGGENSKITGLHNFPL